MLLRRSTTALALSSLLAAGFWGARTFADDGYPCSWSRSDQLLIVSQAAATPVVIDSSGSVDSYAGGVASGSINYSARGPIYESHGHWSVWDPNGVIASGDIWQGPCTNHTI